MEKSWIKQKPQAPGVYWVMGWNLDKGHETDTALAEVREADGELLCEMHGMEFRLKFISEDFHWCGPLVPANA